MSSSFERDLRREMEQNMRGQQSEKPIPCPHCQEEFHIPGQQLVFGGEVQCPHCGDKIDIQSDVADTITSTLSDFRQDLERKNKRRR